MRVQTQMKTAKIEIYADFDFGVAAGIICFVNSKGKSRLNTRWAFQEDALPSSENKNFLFRRRGEETGEGDSLDDSESNLCKLSFDSPHALHGEIRFDFAGQTDSFTGYKISSKRPTKGPDRIWKYYGGAQRV